MDDVAHDVIRTRTTTIAYGRTRFISITRHHGFARAVALSIGIYAEHPIAPSLRSRDLNAVLCGLDVQPHVVNIPSDFSDRVPSYEVRTCERMGMVPVVNDVEPALGVVGLDAYVESRIGPRILVFLGVWTFAASSAIGGWNEAMLPGRSYSVVTDGTGTPMELFVEGPALHMVLNLTYQLVARQADVSVTVFISSVCFAWMLVIREHMVLEVFVHALAFGNLMKSFAVGELGIAP